MTGPYINDSGYEVPDNLILVVPHSHDNDGFWEEVIVPLKGKTKRDWFNTHFYFCLPLVIGNQYGFGIQSLRDFTLYWEGGDNEVKIDYLNSDNKEKQFITNGFRNGVVTIQNSFALKTPPGINIMTIQPPNSFIQGCAAMTGVIETDNIRRDFTFNLKITVPNIEITVKKGDLVGAFIPIPRYFVDNFEVKFVEDVFSHDIRVRESDDANALGKERAEIDAKNKNGIGRRYFNGENPDDTKYKNHQKRI